MGKVFCLPVFSRRTNKIDKLEFPDGDESFTVVSMPRTAAMRSPEAPGVAADETQSCCCGGDREEHQDQVAIEVCGDAFSDPGLYGFSESCATSIDGNNANNIAANNACVLALPEDYHEDYHGDDQLLQDQARQDQLLGDHDQLLGDHDHLLQDDDQLLRDHHVQEEEDDDDDDQGQDPNPHGTMPEGGDAEDDAGGNGTVTTTSTTNRVEEWIKSLDTSSTEPLVELLVGETSSNSHAARSNGGHGHGHSSRDIELANSVARSLDFHSTVAQFSGLGLTLIPCLSTFSHLKVLKLSANSIVRISPGLLPKGLHSLDLSRNKITVIEGLRELTKLRSLNLSHNRILRIGQGLANCGSIRELNLSNNKINEVEGLHRLTKLSCLDLSFNRLASTKSLGQIAATYTSLMAVNLAGNPVLTNVGEEQLKRFVTGLAPNLIVLNKQPVRGGVSGRDAVARSLVAGTSSSSRHSPHHGASSCKRNNNVAAVAAAAASSSSTAAAAAAALRGRGHHHAKDSRVAPTKSIHRVQSDGALQD